MNPIDFLFELDLMLEDSEEEDDWGDTLDELVPELTAICQNLWVLELVVAHCKRRRDGAEL